MRYKNELIKTVVKLRSRGKTYSEIMHILSIKVPKSTLSNWCKNVILPKWYAKKIKNLNHQNFIKVQEAAWAINKFRRERFLKEITKKSKCLIKKLNDKDILKMLLSILYLGEGAKWRSHRGLMLGSSDPVIINLYIRLLNLCYGIKREGLRCRISFRADQNINSLQKYWSKITGISIKNFYKTIPDPRTKGKNTKKKDYKGVCVVTCGGTHIQLELEAIPALMLKGL